MLNVTCVSFELTCWTNSAAYSHVCVSSVGSTSTQYVELGAAEGLADGESLTLGGANCMSLELSHGSSHGTSYQYAAVHS